MRYWRRVKTYRATVTYIAVVVTVLLLIQLREMGWWPFDA